MAKACRATSTRARGGGGNSGDAAFYLLEALAVALLLFAAASPALAAASRLAAGHGHAVAIYSDGTVWTWGRNSYGQLGNGGTQSSPTPARVPALAGVVSVAAGDGFSIALKDDGTVWSWGDNSLGQLGNGTSAPSLTPVQVTGVGKVAAIGAGASHGIAVREDGTVWTWGDNSFWQSGNGVASFSTTAVQVTGIADVVAVAGGEQHTAALRSDGTVWCWGVNLYGQLGDGTRTPRALPVRSAGIDGVVGIAAGDRHTAVVKADGTVWGWGAGYDGQLGFGELPARGVDGPYCSLVPVRTAGLPTAAVAITAALSHTVAVLEDSTVWSWGRSSSPLFDEENGLGTLVPVKMSGASNAIAAAAGDAFTMVLERGGAIRAWGKNDYGVLGIGRFSYSRDAVQVPGISMVSHVAAGYSYSLALKRDGTVWSWGTTGLSEPYWWNADKMSFVPEQVTGLSAISRIAAGDEHSLALDHDGIVWAWGRGDSGQLGNGANSGYSGPVQVTGPTGVTAIAAGSGFSLALASDGTLWCWGRSFGTTPQRLLWDVIAIAAKSSRALVLRDDGTVVDLIASMRVAGLSDVVAIAAGSSHYLALKRDGTLWAWGENVSGQFGDGTNYSSYTPVRVLALTGGVAKIDAGSETSVVLKTDGTVWAWGRGYEAGEAVNRNYPQQILQLPGATEITSSYHHTLALRDDGTVWGWGNSRTGALGIDPGWLPGPLVNMGLSGVTLTAATVGPGAGSLHSVPPGIACSGGLCSYSFPYGALVTLHPTSSGGSLFAGWSGACSGTGDCVMYMTSEKTAYAHFTPAHPVRLDNTPYSSLAEAYIAAGSGALVRSMEGDLLGGLTADREVAVTLSGGYYRDFSGRSALHTRLRGKLVVRGGSVRVDRIKVM